ncbi:hypothetical protein I7I48_09298 [Histoplasma ohiense]|nr:hypothetical protein I7I48_09298 [Histoplasma ohiense (nom. inval.)]
MKLPSSTTLLLPFLSTSYLVTHATAKKDDHVFTNIRIGCCPPGSEYLKAASHPNATGVFSFEGMHLDDRALLRRKNSHGTSTEALKNWTWTTSVMEVRFESGYGSLHATNQVFTLDIPLDVDIYGPTHQRNVCVLLLKMVTVNQNDPGDCRNIFPRAEIEKMKEIFARKVEDMNQGNYRSSPCGGLPGTSWQDIISYFQRKDESLLTRNTTVAAQYYSVTTKEHSPTDYSAYDAALTRIQPIFMMGYSVDPKVLVGPVIMKRQLTEMRLLCVRVREVLEGSRGSKTSASNSLRNNWWLMMMTMEEINAVGIAIWLVLLGGWFVFFGGV